MTAPAGGEGNGAVAVTATNDRACAALGRAGATDTTDLSRARCPLPGKVKLPATNPSVVATSVITRVTDALRHVAGRLRGAAKGSVPVTVANWFDVEVTP